MRTVFSDAVAEVDIRDGLVFVRYPGEQEEFERCMTLRVFELCLAQGTAAVAKHRLREAKIVPIKARREAH